MGVVTVVANAGVVAVVALVEAPADAGIVPG